MTLRVDHISADRRDGFQGAVRLLLFEGGAKPVDASVTVHVERTSVCRWKCTNYRIARNNWLRFTASVHVKNQKTLSPCSLGLPARYS